MDNPFSVGGAGAGGSLLGLIVGYFGLGNRIGRVEKKMEKVVFTDTFIQFEKRCDDNFKDIKEMLKGKKNKEEG